MVSTFTPNKNIEQPAAGDYPDAWAPVVNADWLDIDTALGGASTLNATALSGVVALVIADYRPLRMNVTGTPSGTVTYQVPSGVGGFWVVVNGTTGGQTIQFSSAAGGAVVPIPTGTQTLITCDGSSSGMGLVITTAPSAGGSTTQVQYNSAGILTGSANMTFDGTTLTVNGLQTTGSTALGNASGDTLSIACGTWTLGSNINVNSNALFFNPSTAQLGVGTPTVGSNSITAVGSIKSLAGGFVFPDGSVQLTASTGGGGGSPGGPVTSVQTNGGGTTFSGSALLTFNGATLVAPALSLTTPLPLASGGTGAASAAAARSALGAASAGANTDITSLNSLSSLIVSGAASVGSLSVSGSFSVASLTTGAITASSLTASGAVTSATVATGSLTTTTTITATGAITTAGALTSTAATPIVVLGFGSVFTTGSGTAILNGSYHEIVSGTFRTNAATCNNPSGVWVATSDARLKTNKVGVTADAAIGRLMALKPTTFDWIDEPPIGRPQSDRGFIAQEYAEVYPDEIGRDRDGYMAIGFGRPFMADVVAALQAIWRRLDHP
jgi:trimeric autotransporter adhesin